LVNLFELYVDARTCQRQRKKVVPLRFMMAYRGADL